MMPAMMLAIAQRGEHPLDCMLCCRHHTIGDAYDAQSQVKHVGGNDLSGGSTLSGMDTA